MRILATLARPSSGSVAILGQQIETAPSEVRHHIGLVSHRSLLYSSLSAFQNVSFFARMFGIEDADDRAREMLVELGLKHRMDDPVHTYSRGMEQRCAIARALVHDPDILLLDEPFSGLDPDAAARFQELLTQSDERERTVLLTSHDLSRGADLANRVAFLSRGCLVYDGATADVPAGGMADLYREHCGVRRA